MEWDRTQEYAMTDYFNPYINNNRRTLTLMEMSVEGEKITRNHGLIVAKVGTQMAVELGCTTTFTRALYQSLFFHDIGKNYLPLSLLMKPDKLTYQERELIKEHCMLGFIEGSKSLQEYPGHFTHYEQQLMLTVILTHHERWDGTGYPMGIKGEEITLASRICSYCDVLEALTSGRSYKSISNIVDAIRIITEDSPGQFDPSLKDVFLASIEKLGFPHCVCTGYT